jgi:dTMP kinase
VSSRPPADQRRLSVQETPPSRHKDRARRGLLIAVEGGEAVGKSTQAALLASSLGAEVSREPGGTAFGERVRGLLLDPAIGSMDARAELMMMLAARAQHVGERLRPWLDEGTDVVVDRYSGSTLAYQGYGRELPLEALRVACDLATGGLWPDLTVLLDVPLKESGTRRAGTPQDRIESEDESFHVNVRRGYLELAAAEPASWIVIDGTGEPEDVATRVLTAVRGRLDGRRS